MKQLSPSDRIRRLPERTPETLGHLNLECRKLLTALDECGEVDASDYSLGALRTMKHRGLIVEVRGKVRRK